MPMASALEAKSELNKEAIALDLWEILDGMGWPPRFAKLIVQRVLWLFV
jgi:hypothetical protein